MTCQDCKNLETIVGGDVLAYYCPILNCQIYFPIIQGKVCPYKEKENGEDR